MSSTDPRRRSMCVTPLNSIFLSFSISHSMRNRWGNKRGMFYLGKILVYPDNSYLLFIGPDYQQVPGGGGSEGYHIVSFSPSCLLLSVCSYSCGIHSIPISFHSLHPSQKPPKVKPTPTNPTQHLSGACGQGRVFYCFSFCVDLFTYQVYSLLRHSSLV